MFLCWKVIRLCEYRFIIVNKYKNRQNDLTVFRSTSVYVNKLLLTFLSEFVLAEVLPMSGNAAFSRKWGRKIVMCQSNCCFGKWGQNKQEPDCHYVGICRNTAEWQNKSKWFSAGFCKKNLKERVFLIDSNCFFRVFLILVWKTASLVTHQRYERNRNEAAKKQVSFMYNSVKE